MKKNRSSVYIVIAICLSTFLLIRCANNSRSFDDKRGPAYAGGQACRQCHQAIADSVLLSAHFNATVETSEDNIQGDTRPGYNEFVYTDSTKLAVEKRDSGFYQVLYINGTQIEAHRMDISFGNRNAQTWLYWQDDKTYELPVSYYQSVHSWGTSPGFSATEPNFKRFIGQDCFECHSSNMVNRLNASTAGITEVMVKSSLVHGIDCERCHGPAANHVNFHLGDANAKPGKYITRPRNLTRQQQLDMCAVCHSGNDKVKLESRFRFRPGDTLTHFLEERLDQPDHNKLDVHGNQYALLSASACFLGSQTMTCASCHNPHKDPAGNMVIYSQKCMGCHSTTKNNFCPLADSIGPTIRNNCIDCHMPRQPSNAISFQLTGQKEKSPYMLRNHMIGVYKKDKVGAKMHNTRMAKN
jgi:predicted CXXCH cytochrome family protein